MIENVSSYIIVLELKFILAKKADDPSNINEIAFCLSMIYRAKTFGSLSYLE